MRLGIWDYITATIEEISYEDIAVFVNFATVTETDFTVRVGKKSFIVNEEYLRMLFNLPHPEGEGPTVNDLELQREKALEMQNFYERCVTEDGLKKHPKFKSYIDKNLLLPGWTAIVTIIQEVFCKSIGGKHQLTEKIWDIMYAIQYDQKWFDFTRHILDEMRETLKRTSVSWVKDSISARCFTPALDRKSVV